MSNTNHPQQGNTEWTQSSLRPAPTHSRDLSHRPPFVIYTNSTADRSNKSGTTSRSTSANEVERLLKNQQQLSRTSVPNGGGWRTAAVQAPIQRNSKYHPLIDDSMIPQFFLNKSKFLHPRATIFDRLVGFVLVFLNELHISVNYCVQVVYR
jgi:hypothetical protein